MKLQKMIELCQWDCISFEDAVSLNPYDTYDEINYLRTEFCANFPANWLPRTGTPGLRQIVISTNPFGLYSWMPMNKSDRALVMEYKTRINLYSQYIVQNQQQYDFVTTGVYELFAAEGFKDVGICCRGGQFEEKYLIVFPQSVDKPIVYYTFSIVTDEIEVAEQIGDVSMCFKLIVQDALFQREKILMQFQP